MYLRYVMGILRTRLTIMCCGVDSAGPQWQANNHVMQGCVWRSSLLSRSLTGQARLNVAHHTSYVVHTYDTCLPPTMRAAA